MTSPATGARSVLLRVAAAAHRSAELIGAVTGSLRHSQVLLLGRYATAGRIRLVGKTSRLKLDPARDLTAVGPDRPWTGIRFTASWNSGTTPKPVLVAPVLVAEVDAARPRTTVCGVTRCGANGWAWTLPKLMSRRSWRRGSGARQSAPLCTQDGALAAVGCDSTVLHLSGSISASWCSMRTRSCQTRAGAIRPVIMSHGPQRRRLAAHRHSWSGSPQRWAGIHRHTSASLGSAPATLSPPGHRLARSTGVLAPRRGSRWHRHAGGAGGGQGQWGTGH